MYRFARVPRFAAGRSSFTYVLLRWVWCVAFAVPASAPDAATPSSADVVAAAAVTEARLVDAFAKAPVVAPQLVSARPAGKPRRPKSLVPLYVSFASLQAMDVHSTTRALNRGGVEANPLMRGIADNPLALSAAKAAGSAGVIYAAEKMWRKNRTAAVIFMIAANVGMAFVVQHNYRAVK